MASCPKCSYSLVLLEHRGKYKCALCSRLFPQKEIDDKEFREWNKRQRVLDIEFSNKKTEEELVQISELKIQIKYLFNGLPKSTKEYQKEYFRKNKEKVLQRIYSYREKNKEKHKLNNRLARWRNKQKELAIENFV